MIGMKWILIVIGWIAFGLGILGIFLPLLPTTPFLLLAALCFSKSSDRLHAWLLRSPFAGQIIRDWQEKKVIPLRAKVTATTLLLPTMAYLLWEQKLPAPGLWSLIFLMTGVLLFIWTRKSN